MTTRDLSRDLDVAPSLHPAVRTDGTATGTAVDLRGVDAATIALVWGAWSDGTHTPAIEESDDGTTFETVAAEDLSVPPVALSGAGGAAKVQRIGYFGLSRYIRVRLTTSGAEDGAASAALVLRGRAHRRPVG